MDFIQSPVTSGTVINRLKSYVVLIGFLMSLSGCATLDSVTGKADVEKARAGLEQRLASCKTEAADSEKANAALEKQMSACKLELGNSETAKADLEEQLLACKTEKDKLAAASADIEKQFKNEKMLFEKKEAEYKEKIDNLEKAKIKGISVILFGGDIIYEVAVDAYKEYRAGLRYRSLSDQNFSASFKSFEEGKGGDTELLSVLKEVDNSCDRFVDMNEASRFRKSEEDKYGKTGVPAGAPANPLPKPAKQE